MKVQHSKWLATTAAGAMLLAMAGPAAAQSRSEWQQHNGPAQYASVQSSTTEEMFAAVAPPRPDDSGWFAPTNTNGYFVNASSTVTCNQQVDYTYFQTSFTLEPGNTLEMLELRFAHDDFDDGGMVIVNGDTANAIYVDKKSRTSLNLADQIRQGSNRIVVAQADNCKVLNKVPAMELLYKVRGGAVETAQENDDLAIGEPAGTQPTPAGPIAEPVLTSRGDVHITTNDGLKYDFQAVGDFILLAKGDDPYIVARQRPWEGKPAASVNKAVVFGVAGDLVQFSVQPKRLLVNGVEKPLGAQSLPNGGRISEFGPDDYYIHWLNDDVIARAVLRSQSIDIGAITKEKGVLQGLIGNLNGDPSDDMRIRNGAVLATPASATDLARFGESWRMTRNVFTEPHPEGSTPNDGLVAGAKLSDQERDAARRKCEAGGVTYRVALKDCAYDVAVTGSEEFIESAKDFEESVTAQPSPPRIVEANAEPEVTLAQVNAWPKGRRFTLYDLMNLGNPQTEPAVAAPQAVAANDGGSVFPITGEHFFQQGEKYYSPGGNHYLIFQDDGNLVIYTAQDRFVWGLNERTPRFSKTALVVKQEDGNLAAYDSDGGFIWSARDVVSPPGSALTLQDNGALEIIDPAGNVLYSSSNN